MPDRRIAEQAPLPDDPERDDAARSFRRRTIDRCLAASARMPVGTLHLRSDQRTPEQLADDVLTHLEAPTGRTTPLPS